MLFQGATSCWGLELRESLHLSLTHFKSSSFHFIHMKGFRRKLWIETTVKEHSFVSEELLLSFQVNWQLFSARSNSKWFPWMLSCIFPSSSSIWHGILASPFTELWLGEMNLLGTGKKWHVFEYPWYYRLRCVCPAEWWKDSGASACTEPEWSRWAHKHQLHLHSWVHAAQFQVIYCGICYRRTMSWGAEEHWQAFGKGLQSVQVPAEAQWQSDVLLK